MKDLNVKEAEERAKEALSGLLPGQGGTRVVGLEMPRDVLALSDLARRLAKAINGHASTGMCSSCYAAFSEARKAGLLEVRG